MIDEWKWSTIVRLYCTRIRVIQNFNNYEDQTVMLHNE